MTEDRFGSPLWLTDTLQEHFGPFTIDLCAEPWSAIVPRFITEQEDVFKYTGPVKHGYANDPYGPGQLARFVPYMREKVVAKKWEAVTKLVPHYTAEGWWQHVTKPEGRVLECQWRFGQIRHERLKNWVRLVSEGLVIDLITIKGRLKHRFPPRYSGQRTIARYSSVVVRFSTPEVSR